MNNLCIMFEGRQWRAAFRSALHPETSPRRELPEQRCVAPMQLPSVVLSLAYSNSASGGWYQMDTTKWV